MLRNLLIMGLIAPLLSGCLFAAAAGGAAGGYYVAKDERTAGQITDDAVISTKVKSKLIAASDVSALRIDVDVRNQVVYLNGQVRSDDEKSRAIEIAAGTSGVIKVVSELKVISVAIEDRGA